MANRQELVIGLHGAVYFNETVTKQEYAGGGVQINDTTPAPPLKKFYKLISQAVNRAANY